MPKQFATWLGYLASVLAAIRIKWSDSEMTVASFPTVPKRSISLYFVTALLAGTAVTAAPTPRLSRLVTEANVDA